MAVLLCFGFLYMVQAKFELAFSAPPEGVKPDIDRPRQFSFPLSHLGPQDRRETGSAKRGFALSYKSTSIFSPLSLVHWILTGTIRMMTSLFLGNSFLRPIQSQNALQAYPRSFPEKCQDFLPPTPETDFTLDIIYCFVDLVALL